MPSVPFVTRQEWGAKPRAGAARIWIWGDVRGLSVHWPAAATTPNDHAQCAGVVRGEQAFHMSHGYRDIAYNALICKHGYVFEGRWLNDESGANGTTVANETYFAVTFLLGEHEAANDSMWAAFRWVRHQVLAKNIHATDVQPHSHFVADQCPGNYLRADITAGKWKDPAPAPTPPAPKPVPPKPAPIVSVSLSRLIHAAKVDPGAPQGHTTYGAGVKVVEQALADEHLLAREYARDGSFGTLTIKAYAAWQRKLGYTGKAADGIPGKASLTALGKKHHFAVVA